MARLYFKVRASDIRRAVKAKVSDPIIALTKNPDVMRVISREAIDIVTPYVPMKEGNLRKSVHIVHHGGQIQIVWGDSTPVRRYMTKAGELRTVTTAQYASFQHNADDSNWNRHTPGTKSQWTDEIKPGSAGFDELVDRVTPIIRKEVSRGSK